MVITKKAIHNEACQKKISEILSKLNIKYIDISKYILAFIHRSIVNERPDFTPEHNERLEFLGDAVLELVVTDNLFKDFPEKPEGDLTDIRSALVRGTNLAKVGKNLGFPEYLFLGKGEEKSGGRNNHYLLANVVESFIGALYLDKGYIEAENFINTHIYPTIDNILKNNLTKDFKTLIQEYVQAKYDITPHYNVLDESGPDHDKNFVVGVYLKDKIVGEGEGTSKKKAQEVAAKNGYEGLLEKGFIV